MATKRKRLDKNTLIIIGAVLGLETVALGGVVLSIHNKKAALEKTLAGKEAALADVRTVSASLPAMQEQYTKMQAQVKFLEHSLPPAEYIPTLLGQVEETARVSGVSIQSFRPRAATPAPAADGSQGADASDKRQFDLTINGSYTDVQKFLHALTKFSKILALDSIQLQPGQTDQVASPTLTGNLGFTAFILPPAPADAAPAAPASQAPSGGSVAASAPSGGTVASNAQATAPRG